MENKKALKFIRDNWGKEAKSTRDYDSMSSFFAEEYKTEDSIDDNTWEDLNMNEIFSRLDRTYSTVGENSLYGLLRNPIKDNDCLKKRNKIVNNFENNVQVREKTTIELHKLGKTYSNIGAVLYNKLDKKPLLRILCYILSYGAMLDLFSLFFIRNKVNLYLLVLLTFVNMFIHYRITFKLNNQIISVAYLNKIIKTAKNICNIKNPELNKDNIIKAIKNCKKMYKRSSNIIKIEGLDVIGEYINTLFLLQEINYFSLISEIETHKIQLRELVLFVGEIDALLSIASYRAGLNQYSVPILTFGSKTLKVKNIFHPLINNPVSNSIELDTKGIIITGSNMSGKSTFLKTLAVNVIFAQTICTCLCSEYYGSYFNILTSIVPADDIISGKSYYMGEVEAIHRIILKCKCETPCIAFIDEIFRGTNSVERINSSAVILDYLMKHNALVIVATHDLELTKLLADYTPYYFRENISKDGLTFDFTIKKGVSPTRNAVRLLEYKGYPTEIISEIDKRIANLQYCLT